MEADDLASADELWWSWAVLAADGRLPEGAVAELDAAEHVLSYAYGDSSVFMQRIGGGRAVIWGTAAGSTRDAVSEHLDVLDGAPDWASSNAAWRSIRNVKPGFLAWYSRDGWDTSTSGMFDGVVDLVTPLLRADPRLVAEAKSGIADAPLLRQAHGVAHVAAQGAIRKRLRSQIHRQMREAEERDRGLPERPTLLARWHRVSEPGINFEHTVVIDEGELVTLGDAPPLPDPLLGSLTNVLRELHRGEAGEESGAWIAAQVRVSAGRISLVRAFDSLPPWYDGKGPTLRALGWEMQQRSTAWRPTWATLLPD
ncbi:hypothetical protein EFK50_05710 [Nocardioides marmoriginsengisoli]|uniref:Uncharacterized protein n=1 Tax=Nocardioides marmoriginsengisoli TaxID=661483 RepID=A0A3N0CPQ2_9ACTN|nr:hypothetical protein [Nocardioides marmoriginsengisoli]RNL65447.1 hypothetical protein EFK50_05710 [Nocardioides marmoriginsengisoli]